MRCDGHVSPTSRNHPTLYDNVPYSSSLATSASVSATSVWSAASQSSDDSSLSSVHASDSDSCESACSAPRSRRDIVKLVNPWLSTAQHVEIVAPPELRKNPRRSSSGPATRSGFPPHLVRQTDRKVDFVDNLVDSSTQIVEAIWPTSSVFCRSHSKDGGNAVLPLRTFIQETLRRSRSSYSTLQVALYYLVLIKPHVPAHDFTMEQPDDSHAGRALQCGRRMFLAALILASKYLQDRNYSSRAWSKISGLQTDEINQNEMAFLIAVNWKLHITDDVYHRWTDCVMKFSPSQPPPSSPTASAYNRQCGEFRRLIVRLTPELDNLEDVAPCSPTSSWPEDFTAVPQRFLSAYELPSQTPPSTPKFMEPSPAIVHSTTACRPVPALGLLPTPRLTPQMSGFSTPAVSAVPNLLGKSSSAMGFAMAQMSSVSAALTLDRWPASASTTSSPLATGPTSAAPARRLSLANSISTASSPESMVSDSSRTSRSSSICSASSLVSAPSSAVKLDVQARFRSAKQYSERFAAPPTIAPVPEDYGVVCFTSSPEAYTGPVGKDMEMASLETPLARRERELKDGDAAARVLQTLQAANVPRSAGTLKRRRPHTVDNVLQDNVRDILRSGQLCASGDTAWPETLLRTRLGAGAPALQVPVPSARGDARKRVCCSADVVEHISNLDELLHPSMNGLAGPGMWEGILN